MERYSVIDEKDKREIVLLKSFPCKWGKCTFCDYIDDNSQSISEMVSLNREVLNKVTGKYNKLEVINSASVFELPAETLKDIKDVVKKKDIKTLVFEVFYNYRNRLDEIRNYFSEVKVEFKTGIETFDEDFRNNFLNKKINVKNPEDVKEDFDVICLLVGIKGQTKEMIRRDMELSKMFPRVCINIFINNDTDIKRDEELVQWFKDEYGYLDANERYDILWNNTDFGVGD